jgi:2-oxoglutarate ferredoxin oxidoreductase subunit beta
MATTTQLFKQVTLPDLKGKADPDWCPGCGDFGVLTAFEKALVELQIQPHNVVKISGIGCSSNLPGYISTYGMHTLHGRALAVATGVKLANHQLTVVVTGGDGDGFGIGGNHFIHTMRRNLDLLYLAMDNQIYGLTTGQTSPTSQLGMKTKMEERTRLARELQTRAMDQVVYIPFGQWNAMLAYRADRLDGIVPNTGLVVLWNIAKK